MKHVGTNDGKAHFGESLIEDLSFIRKKLRYPLRYSTMRPFLLWSALLLVSAALIVFLLTLGVAQDYRWVFFLMPWLFPIVIMVRYWRSLQFRSVISPYFLSQHLKLLEAFLSEQQLLVYRHPQAAELFQIVSRNVSATREDRELMLFIVDDKRVLVNSRFIRSGWSLMPEENHVDEMCKALASFIARATAGFPQQSVAKP